MFCPKCGMELPDGSQFCPACGAQLGAQTPAPQAAPQQGAKPAGIFTMPSVGSFAAMFVALLCFIFGFLPLISSKYGGSAGLFSGGSAFDVNVLLGFGKIFMIIQIILFFVYLASQFVDFNKFLNIPFKVSEKMPIIYFACFGVALLFTFIGALIGVSGFHFSPAVCWYFAVVFCICGFVLVFKPDLLNGLIKKQ